MGAFIFIAFGFPITQASTLASYLAPPKPPIAGGYGFSPQDIAFFTFSAWIGMLAAQLYGYLFHDRQPLWIARRPSNQGRWRPEFRLVNLILPSVLLPIGLGLYGAGLQYHLHFMVLAVASFLIWFSALLLMPVCYNYG